MQLNKLDLFSGVGLFYYYCRNGIRKMKFGYIYTMSWEGPSSSKVNRKVKEGEETRINLHIKVENLSYYLTLCFLYSSNLISIM